MLLARLLSAPPDVRRRHAAAMLGTALVLHDLQEALAYLHLRPTVLELLPFAPPPAAAWTALAAVTVGGVAAALWAGCGRASAAKTGVLLAMAAILLANILIPHVPAAVLLGGYAPGLATAVAVNLPTGTLAWALLRREA